MDQGERGSISSRVIPKTKIKVLDTSLLNTQHYKVRIKGKVEQSRKTPSCNSYRKGSLLVTLDYGHQLYLLLYEISVFRNLIAFVFYLIDNNKLPNQFYFHSKIMKNFKIVRIVLCHLSITNKFNIKNILKCKNHQKQIQKKEKHV